MFLRKDADQKVNKSVLPHKPCFHLKIPIVVEPLVELGRKTLLDSKIPYTLPSITEIETAYVTDAARNGWGDRCYEYIARFESAFRKYLNIPHAIATSSCTGSLHMGMAALGICPGDEVILADTNWVATVSPVVHLGATPIFVDILPDSWCLDPDEVLRAITPRTKAIIATHIYGNLADMGALRQIADAHGLFLIEDAAEALGGRIGEAAAGTLSDFGAFSFHGTKTLTTGEGGMFVTHDDALFEKVLTLSNHGRARGQEKQFFPNEVGFKFKMSNIEAALGCGQMDRIDALTARKREILARYQSYAAEHAEIQCNPVQPGTKSGAWMPSFVFDKETGIGRDHLIQAFRSANIDARVFFYPLSATPLFSPRKGNLNAWDIPERAINLPSFHDMTDAHFERILGVVDALLQQT